jgi:hypothetical protein
LLIGLPRTNLITLFNNDYLYFFNTSLIGLENPNRY